MIASQSLIGGPESVDRAPDCSLQCFGHNEKTQSSSQWISRTCPVDVKLI